MRQCLAYSRMRMPWSHVSRDRTDHLQFDFVDIANKTAQNGLCVSTDLPHVDRVPAGKYASGYLMTFIAPIALLIQSCHPQTGPKRDMDCTPDWGLAAHVAHTLNSIQA